MIDTIDLGGVIGHQAGQYQASAGAQVGGHHGSAGERFYPFHQGCISRYGNISAQAPQFTDVDESVFKNRFRNQAGALSNGHENHELGLHVGGEPRVWQGFYVDAGDAVGTLNTDTVSGYIDLRAGELQFVNHGFNMLGLSTRNGNITTGKAPLQP